MTDKELIKQEIERRIKNLSYLIPNIGNAEDLTKEEFCHCVEQETLKSLLIFINSIEYPSPKFKIGDTIRDKEGETGAFTITDIKVEDKSLVYLGNKRQKVSIWCQDDYEIVNNDLSVKENPVSEDLKEELDNFLKDPVFSKLINRNAGLALARHFAEWGRNHFEDKSEMVSDDLEEAIGLSFIYHENHGDDFRSDKQIETAYRYGFETGAKWQKKKDLQDFLEKAERYLRYRVYYNTHPNNINVAIEDFKNYMRNESEN